MCRINVEVCANVAGQIVEMDEEALTGYRLLCSAGDEYRCKGRVSTAVIKAYASILVLN